MNRLILPIVAFAMFLTIAGATSNTVFTHNGIAGGTQWEIDIFPTYNSSSFNVVLAGTSNSFSTNALSAYPSGTFSYVAGYNLAGVYTYVYGNLFPNNIGGNIIVNFAPISNSTNSTFASCNKGQSVCAPVTGTLNTSTSILQNHVLGPPYSANLTIYINPAGYYEYIVQNASLGENPSTRLPLSYYLNILPNQTTTNVTFSVLGQSFKIFNSSPTNALIYQKNKTVATIFYSQLIDISPVEYDMLGGNLTPQAFGDFVYANDGSFLNTTVVYSTSATLASAESGIFGDLEALLNSGAKALAAGTGPIGLAIETLFPVKLTGLTSIPYSEGTTAATQGVRVMLDTIPNSTASFPMYVSYTYPNTLCPVGFNLVICTQSGQKGMLAFNNYIDNTYAPEILMNQFLTVDAVLILGFALIMLITKKINGE